MANNEIKLDLLLQDNGSVDKVAKDTKKLKKDLDDVASSATNASKSVQAAMKASTVGGGALSGEGYRNARGVAGTGGGDSRDFAKQAQGLGGLVHLYATFAANIFAVGAAFSVLDKAMNVERMQQAADVMSSKMGVNIKVLAQDLQKATDNALSFNEALQVSARTLATGETPRQIKDLVTVAKGASVVMGVSLSEAIERVTQGTAKQEKKILDDLGIILKASDAYKKYAEAHGLVVSSLSAVQKQQAFTDAVIEQGLKKFKNASDLATSPYDKLVASLKDVGFSLLNIVNTLLTPIATFLANNKAIIFALLGGITTFLLNKALPAINSASDALSKAQADNAAKAKALIEQVTKAKNIHTDVVMSGLSGQIAESQKAMQGLKDTANSALEDIAKNISKTNTGLKTSLTSAMSGTAENLVAIRDDLDKQLTRSISGLRTAAETARKTVGGKGVGIYSKMGEDTREAKATEMLARAEVLEKSRLALMTAETGEVAKIAKEMDKILLSQTKINNSEAESLDYNTKVANKIKEIRTQEELRANTLKQVENFSTTIRDPLSSMKEKFQAFTTGLASAGNIPKTPGIEEELGKVSLISKTGEKASFIFKALGNAAEAAFAVLGKFFMVVTVLTLIADAVEGIVRWFGGWNDTTSKLSESQTQFNDVLKTQKEYFEKNKELLQSTSLDTDGYISKWGGLANIYDQATQKLKELIAADDELSTKGGYFNKLWDSLSGNNLDRLKAVKDELTTLASDPNVNKGLQQSARDLANSMDYAEKLTDAQKKAAINVMTANKVLIENNKATAESFKSLNSDITAAFDKIDEHSNTFKNKHAEDVFNKIESGYKSLFTLFKQGAIDARGFADGIGSYVDQLSQIPDALKKLLPTLAEYLIIMDTIKNLIVNPEAQKQAQAMGPEEFLKKQVTDRIKVAKEILNSQAMQSLTQKAEEDLAQIKKEAQSIKGYQKEKTSGLSIEDKAQIKGMQSTIQEITSNIRTLDEQLKDNTALNARITAIKGYLDETDLITSKQLTDDKILAESRKDAVTATMEFYKIEKDIGSTAELKAQARIDWQNKLNDIQKRSNIQLKESAQILKDRSIDEYIKKQAQLVSIFKDRLSAGQDIYDNMYKLGQISDSEKIAIDSQIKRASIEADKNQELETLFGNLQKGSLLLTEYFDARARALEKYGIALDKVNRSEITEQELARRTKLEASLNNQISAVQSIMDIESASGKVSIANIEKRMQAEEDLFQKRMVDAKKDPEKQRALEIEKANRLYKAQLELLDARKKNFDSLTTDDKLQTVADEAYKRILDFKKGMKDSVTGTFDAIYGGMDAAIDELTTKMMQGVKISFKDIINTFRNTAAEEFRKMAADRMKLAAREGISKLIGAVTGGKGPDLRTFEEKQIDLLGEIAKNTGITAKGGILDGTMVDTSKGTGSQKEYSKAIEDTVNAQDQLAQQTPSLWKSITDGFSGIFGSDGIIMSIFGSMGKGILGLLQPLFSLFGMGSIGGIGSAGGISMLGSLGGLFSGGFSDILGSFPLGSAGTGSGILGALSQVGSFFGFANGGIMSQYGAVSLNKYSNGGIANSPQLAMYGEGRQPEAYVPLPDGRSIPVTMQSNSGGAVSVNINITDNSTTSTTDSQGTGKDYSAMSKIIASKVQEELVKQKRPGGILY